MTEEAQRRFAEVVVPLTDQAFRLAVWLVRSRADAEDIVQDAALRAFRAIDGFSGTNARAWFLTIVRHTALTWLGKNRPKDLVSTEDLDEAERQTCDSVPAFGAETPPTPETALLASERAHQVQQAVGGLAAPYREVVVMRDLEGLSYREIADILDVPIGTVMSRLARGRSILVRTLANDR